jgi:hypothetical protein
MTILGYTEILDHALAFLKDDYTELWVIAGKIKDMNPEFNTLQILEATKIVAADLVTNHNAVLVDMHAVRPINKPTIETIEIINKHLDQFDKIPDIGDGLWISIEDDKA